MSNTRGRRARGTVAELSAAAEAIDSYQARVGALAASWRQAAIDDNDEDDVSTAIEEAERALGIAQRAVRRAIKLAAR